MKTLLSIMLLAILSLVPKNSFNNSSTLKSRTNRLQSRSSSSQFQFLYAQRDEQCISENKKSYFTYSTAVYYLPYTDSSNLMLIKTETTFTPGYVAYGNDHKDFDPNSYLKRGYVHITPHILMDTSNGRFSPSFSIQAAWPKSSKSTISFSSSFSQSTTISSQLTAGVSTSDGAYLEANIGTNVTLTLGESTTVTTDEPSFSQQKSPTNIRTEEFSFIYNTKGMVSYYMTSYVLVETATNATGFNDLSIVYTIDTSLTTISSSKEETIRESLDVYANLGYKVINPSIVL